MDDVRAWGSDKKSWFGSMTQFAQAVFDNLWPKRAELLSTAEYFVTSDHPMVVDYSSGVGPSEVFFPVGSHRALLFSAGLTLDSPQLV
jgi:hypothetical protein